jgi:LysR family glycine cleavage system transcriptional activator
MSRRLPPLNALRAFEAAARHLSFTRGAAELFVTQAAVSHQVKALEEHLQVKLFRRLDRALALTEEGEAYFRAVCEVFDRLDEATARIVAKSDRQVLTISLLPSFAARWLVPRLGRFREMHPHIDVRLDPEVSLVDFTGEVDVAIRYGRGQYPGLRSDRLLEEEVFPVCSPSLLERPPPLSTPDDLRHHVLLHDESYGDWQTWLLAAGVRGVDATRGPMFTDSSMLLEAAVGGQGVALGRSVLAERELAAGRLVRPFPMSKPADYAYYVVCPEAAAERPKVRVFREWILDEAKGNGADPAPPGDSRPARRGVT